VGLELTTGIFLGTCQEKCEGFEFSIAGESTEPVLNMAEGVVSNPLLPSGGQGRKGGFATFADKSHRNAYFPSRIK
jgi:hypothetical protein